MNLVPRCNYPNVNIQPVDEVTVACVDLKDRVLCVCAVLLCLLAVVVTHLLMPYSAHEEVTCCYHYKCLSSCSKSLPLFFY